MRGSPFFDGVDQSQAGIGDEILKVPVFYYDGEMTVGVFPAKLSALRKMLPDRRISPARLAPGIGAIAVTCYEYRDTDIHPYNELAIAIPLNEPHFRSNLPGRALLESQRSGQFPAFVHHLPVTTELARAGGKDFYNYPKFLASIDYGETSGKRECRLAEGEEPILKLTCDKLKARKSRDLQVFTKIWMDQQPQGAEFKIRAHKLGMTARPGAARLELGERHPISRELSSALLSTSSIAAAYTPQIEGILYGPETVSFALLDRVRGERLAGAEALR